MDMFGGEVTTVLRYVVKFLYIAYDILEPVYFAYLIVQMISNWFIFKKAGEKKWKAIIPVYKDYIQAKISWSTKIFWVFVILQTLIWVYLLGVNELDRVMPLSIEAEIASYIIFAIMAIALQVLTAIAWVKLAQSFGKSKGFAAGLVLLNIVFLPILAFDNSEYKGNQRL